MKSAFPGRQRGAALILFATVLILGVASFTVGALGKAAPTPSDREIRSGNTLQDAKRALLGYAQQYAARTVGAGSAEPGQMPCPEALTSIGTASEGIAAAACSNVAPVVGRLPWRTLGVDQLRDGDGEPLWYVLSPGFRSSPINFGTPGQLSFDGAPNAAVALIIAPGRPLNTLPFPGVPSPASCAKVNQQAAARNTAPLNVANFLECGNAGTNFENVGTSQWTNDRVITVTAAEWADAIGASVGDRLQRQIAPVLADWDAIELAATGRSWGATHGLPYLPYASAWSDPTANIYCGSQGQTEGLAPIAMGCSNNPWTGIAVVLGLVNIGCTDAGPFLRCQFMRLLALPPFSVVITATSQDVARAFRSTIDAADLTVTGGGTATLSMALNGATSDATATINATWPPALAPFTVVEVQIPHLTDAAVLGDARLSWFRTNNWHHYAYYAVGPAYVASPALPCAAPSDPGCLIVNGLPASTGIPDDKRLAMVLSGRALAGLAQPSPVLGNYFESQNASTGDRTFEALTVTGVFNDRIAACPFQHTPAGGGPIALCN